MDKRPALLMTGSVNETVRLWRPDELAPVGPSSWGRILRVISIVAHPASTMAASASLDGFIRVFDVDSNTFIAAPAAPPSKVWNMQFDLKEQMKSS
ncbi:putative WD repeat-containing protein VIP3 [Cocos nucifera]|uniref:Putative WD repeat-containing protein VIP3 n=1 Tax=Cocos nucifera TaxID=13894 RepID=A0A8K0I6D2_COCNU|nr:putative WD repeat-containing protein VIP3 [Cocos nucifera]